MATTATTETSAPGGRRMRVRIAASAGATVALALSAVVWSELWFWGRWRAEDSPAGLAQTVVAYALVVQVCRFAAQRLGVRSGGAGAWRRVLLVGLLFGWLVEGVLVTTTVEDLPLSIAWTGMAWHALLTVLLGWWWVPRALARPASASLIRLVLVGIGVGAWGAFWRFEEGVVVPPVAFALYVGAATGLHAVGLAGWWALRRTGPPGRIGTGLSLAALLVIATVHAAAFPLTLLGPALAGAAAVALVLTRSTTTEPDAADDTPHPHGALPRLVVIPAAAVPVHALLMAVPEPLPTGWVVYAVTVPLSVVLTVLSLRRDTARTTDAP